MAVFNQSMKNITSDLKLTFESWIKSWSFIFKNNLGHFFLFSIGISILLSFGSIVLIKFGTDYIMKMISPYFEYTPMHGTWTEMLTDIFKEVSKYATAITIFIMGFFVFAKFRKYLVLALMAPLMAWLSEKTDEILRGSTSSFKMSRFFRDLFRGILIAIRNFFLELIITLFLLGMSLFISLFLPLLSILLLPVISIAIFLTGAYFFGFSVMDFSNEKNSRGLRESARYIRKNSGIAFVTGAIFSLFFSLPLLGVTIGTVTCTVSAAIAIHEKEKESAS